MNFTLKNRLRFLPETVIVSIIAVPLILTEKSTHFMYNHTCRMGNGSGSRRRLLNPVQAALKSPFSKSIHTAIPPPAALCDFTTDAYYSFSSVCSFVVLKCSTEREICQEGFFPYKTNYMNMLPARNATCKNRFESYIQLKKVLCSTSPIS